MSGKVAVVTGGTGVLGGAVVETLLADGWQVHAPVRGSRPALRLTALPGAEEGLRLHEADLTDSGSVERLFAAVGVDPGRLDLLCNVVGGFAMAPVEETSPETWSHMLELNATTTFLAVRAATPLLRASGGGRIVNVAAAAALGPGAPKLGAYLAAKSAVLSLTTSLARELGPSGITVNVLAPTTIDTPSNREAMPDADRTRWLDPGEIARVVRFLAGPDAGVVNGSILRLARD